MPGPGHWETDSRRVPWQAQFLLLSAAWGCSFLFIKLGVESFAPLWVSFGRVLLSAAFLLAAL